MVRNRTAGMQRRTYMQDRTRTGVTSMSEKHDSGSNYDLTQRSAVARRQLHASIGALLAIAVLATATALSVRVSTAPAGLATADNQRHRPVMAPVRQAPSQRMQATDQAKSDRGS